MKASFFKILLVTFIFIVFSACQNKGKDYHLYSIEKEILQDPHKAYNYLDSIGKEIKDAPDSTQMFYQILLCRAKDKCYIRHKSDSTMQNVVKYYKSRNDKEHLMQAYYCMGCINRDLQQADKALKYFHNALDCSKNSNKYELIARIYSQMGQLQQDGYADEFALKSFQNAYIYFKKTNETKTISAASVDLARAYTVLNDSAHGLYYAVIAKNEILKTKNPQMLAKIYNFTINFYLKYNDCINAEKEYMEASKVMKPEDIDQPLFNYMKGILDFKKGDNKSALENVKKATKDNMISNRYCAYNYLIKIYRDGYNNYKEALNCAVKTINTLDTMRTLANDEGIRKMQHMYNYEKTQKENALLNITNLRNQRYLFIALILLLLTAVIIILLIVRSRNRRRQIDEIMKEMEQKNAESEEQIIKNEKEIEKLKDKNEELTQLQIGLLKEKNNKIKQAMSNNEAAWTKFYQSEAFNNIHNVIRNGELECQYKDAYTIMKQLEKTIDVIFNFSGRLKRYYPKISNTQLNICYLIKSDFKLHEIAILLAMSKSAVTNARNKMKKDCFDDSVSLEDMDKFIHDW